MKLKPVLWTAGLLLFAALLGWILPALAFPERKNAVEEAPSPVEIRGVDLSYDSDLSTTDRFRLVRETTRDELKLEHGVYLRREEVWSLLDAFLFDLTNQSFSISEANIYAEPVLETYQGYGAFVVWEIRGGLEPGWELEAVLDDQSGAILQLRLQGYLDYEWKGLFPEVTDGKPLLRFLREQVRDAFRSQLRRRLSEDWDVDLDIQETDHFNQSALLRLLESGEEVYAAPFIIQPESLYLRVN